MTTKANDKKPEGKKILEQVRKIADGNSAAAEVAYALSEVAAIYPITPSSPMSELSDAWAAKNRTNLFGDVVKVAEMQSEAGAAGAVHGILSGGVLATTFTASQGLLLMIPNMYKIAGELLPTVFHVAARSLATHALSIFCDHSDVMATRSTGFAMLASSNVQEAHDFAAIAHAATLKSLIPFMHFFDGFRTSHEIQTIAALSPEILLHLVDIAKIADFRRRSLNPNNPSAKVGAQNPDVYFQSRELANTFYFKTPAIVAELFERFSRLTGRSYKLFDYTGAADATDVIVIMGSGAETVTETVAYLTKQGKKVGVMTVRLFRPFSLSHFKEVLPKTVERIAVLDRTRDPGALGEPLYQDIVTATHGMTVSVIGGRYGLSSKEFTPGMVCSIFNHLREKGTHNFTVGIVDDVTHLSLPKHEEPAILPEGTFQCMFWGFGSDGTVSANKSTLKIIGSQTNKHVQGYFSYDSKKSGGTTVSHLRFSDSPIKAPYLITQADMVAVHRPSFMMHYDVLETIKEGGLLLVNAPVSSDQVFNSFTREIQEKILARRVKVFCIDAFKIAREAGLGGKISTVMQVAFFAVAQVLPMDDAVVYIKKQIAATFSAKGKEIVDMNYNAVDAACAAVHEVSIPYEIIISAPNPSIPSFKTRFEHEVIGPIMKMKGDMIPLSALPSDGQVPTGTTQLEKRGIALKVPRWISEKCIQCGLCSFVCPHAAIRMNQMAEDVIADAPSGFVTISSNTANTSGLRFRVQVYPEDCTGCTLCVSACPLSDKALTMQSIEESRGSGECERSVFFDTLPENLNGVEKNSIKWSQFKKPLFEFSGACSGCGETSYIKLLTQLFGERMIIANATGCSSIYGGTFPTIPYTTSHRGKGPAWANSLFEDNAEYGFGIRLAIDAARVRLRRLLVTLAADVDGALRQSIRFHLERWQETSDEIITHADTLKEQLSACKHDLLTEIIPLIDYIVERSVWCIGGDGWAYDIGFGGLDHVLAQGKNINILVLDNEQYANTGGQASKATPTGAIAKFASLGKDLPKKDLGLMMMSYGNIYVASINMGADKLQVVKALQEAESYDGPSLVIAYGTCINHGVDMAKANEMSLLAGKSGHWPLYRYDPRTGFTWDGDGDASYDEFVALQKRFTMLKLQDPERAAELMQKAKKQHDEKRKAFKRYES